MVGERRVVGRRSSASAAGRNTSANPGMSSEKQSENLCRRKPKVFFARFVREDSGGPKPRRQRVGDGQQVESPAPLEARLTQARCRGGRGATRRGSFKLVGRHSNPGSVTEKRARAQPARVGQVPDTWTATKGLAWEPSSARTGHRHRWIGRADQGGRANPG